MLGSAAAIAFVPSTDLDRARDFFATTLGLAIREQSDYALVLDAGSTMLRVTKVDQLSPQPFTVFGWRVDDIVATLESMRATGVSPLRFEGLGQDEAGVWSTPGGDKVAWFHDPDGNTLSLTQLSDDS